MSRWTKIVGALLAIWCGASVVFFVLSRKASIPTAENLIGVYVVDEGSKESIDNAKLDNTSIDLKPDGIAILRNFPDTTDGKVHPQNLGKQKAHWEFKESDGKWRVNLDYKIYSTSVSFDLDVWSESGDCRLGFPFATRMSTKV